MLVRFASPLLVTTLLAGCGCPTRGSGVRAEETRDIGAFSGLEVEGSMDVFVQVGPAPSAKVIADENVVKMIETELVGDTLHVRTRGSFVTSGGLEVYLTTPALEEIEVSGSGDVKADGIEASEVVFELSGSGDLVASGKTDALTVAVSGSGDVDTTQLSADAVKVSVSGSGDAKVGANTSLRADVSGSGSVRWRGDAEVEEHVSGSGSVRPL